EDGETVIDRPRFHMPEADPASALENTAISAKGDSALAPGKRGEPAGVKRRAADFNESFNKPRAVSFGSLPLRIGRSPLPEERGIAGQCRCIVGMRGSN